MYLVWYGPSHRCVFHVVHCDDADAWPPDCPKTVLCELLELEAGTRSRTADDPDNTTVSDDIEHPPFMDLDRESESDEAVIRVGDRLPSRMRDEVAQTL